MSYRVGDARRGRRPGRPTKLSRHIEVLYREGKCRECSVSVTRMNFAKILGKFTKVKIQYESGSREKSIEKKVTSPSTNARLRSNENGMVLIHRSAYKEHPVKETLAVTARKAPVDAETPRRRGRPPKNKNLLVEQTKELTTTQYRIIFSERRESLDASSAPDEASIGTLLQALSWDVLPTDEWLVDCVPSDEPKKDHVYDRIAAELEGLMYDAKPAKTEVGDGKPDDFPSIMELLNDTLVEPERRDPADKSEAAGGGDVEAILRGDTDAPPAVHPSQDSKQSPIKLKQNEETPVEKVITCTPGETKSEENTESAVLKNENEKENKKCDDNIEKALLATEDDKIKPDAESSAEAEHVSLDNEGTTTSKEDDTNLEKMEVDDAHSTDSKTTQDQIISKNESSDLSNDKNAVTPMDTDEVSDVKGGTDELSKNVKPDSHTEAPAVNGKGPLLADQNINVETINYIIFKRVKNEHCNRLVKCSKNLNYSVEMEGRPVELLGAPKHISCIDDLRLMLQIVHESDLNSFNVVHGG